MIDPTAQQNFLFSFFGEAPFESDTIFKENGRIRESACGGARQWQEDVDGLGVFDDGAVFLNGVEEQWDSGFLTVWAHAGFWHPGHEWHSCGVSSC